MKTSCKKTERIKRIVYVVPVVLLIFSCLLTFPGLPFAVFATKYFLLYFFALITAMMNIWSFFSTKVKFTQLDCCMTMFFIYLFVANIQSPLSSVYDNRKLVIFGCSMSVFLYIRLYASTITSRLVIVGALLSYCLINCIVSLFQKFGYLSTNNQSHDITGTFFHPAPLAGMLAMMMPLCLFFYSSHFQGVNTDKRLTKAFQYLSFWTVSFILITIPSLHSRAGSVALVLGCALFFMLLYKDRLEKMSINLKRIGILAVSISLPLLVGALYMMRTDSVHGRVLVWKITGRIITDKPLFGHGLDSFKTIYPGFQTDYFRAHINNAGEVLLSGEVTMAFNEFLQLWSEMGIVGLAILLAMLGLMFGVSKNTRHGFDGNRTLLNLGIKAALFAFCIFSLFSYPFSIVELSLFFFILMGLYDFPGGVGSKWLMSAKGTRQVIKAVALALPVFVVLGVRPVTDQFVAYRNWYKAVNATSVRISDLYYGKAYEKLKENGVFVSNLVAFYIQKNEHKKAIDLLERKKGKTYDDLMALGDCHSKLGFEALAAPHYQTAYFLLPHKFAPLGKLLDIYIKLDREEDAKNIAKNILEKEIKIPSDSILAIRERAFLFNKLSEDD